MNRIFKIVSVLSLAILFANCQKDDGVGPVEARPHPEVYPEDLVKIETYLKTHYLDVNDSNLNGEVDVNEISILPLDDSHTVSVWDQTDYPLLSKIAKIYGVDFKVYYLKLDGKGDTDADGNKPCGVDRVLVSYRGNLLDGTEFDYAPNPVEFNLIDLVKGWEYVFPEFRAGFFDAPNGDGTLNPRDYGAGVMFLPSGLGYYNQNFGNVPSYSPLVFAFNFYAVTYLDQDFDKIPSRYEYVLNADGSLLDTDGDGIPNLFDSDDDNDGYLTKNEIKYTVTDNTTVPETVYTYYYPFNGAAVDDVTTPFVDETKGIPNCGGTDYTSSTRVRKHLDNSCH
ncbi:hypothetical protein FCR2A7T_19040 [Flavobacterium cauense R2A-7]|uniref:peptidylprolyl isomerase n=1 Tax=Flavobacterium cauense R2A-7 TaxID=1341154 RepID=V6S4W6_9FLAO|nr:hypothetical protein [Flavobacterium cauense]ESU19440.1 hypothetical protein FCR2A7T_19040 [Flavobacterium cauense R2A-7]TWI09196.1 hypothetical protein IP98_02548 [Flavobacterium cauense R2A-7]